MTEPISPAKGYSEFTITRVFDAPRELVFRAWTDPDQFSRWWGGRGTTTPRETMRMDVRPGGEWYADMTSDADGSKHPFAASTARSSRTSGSSSRSARAIGPIPTAST